MKSKKLFKTISLLFIGVFLVTACNLPFGILQKDSQTQEPPISTFIPAEELYGDQFATFNMRDVLLPDKFVGGYSLPLNESQVNGLAEFSLTKSQQSALLQNGFVVTPPETDPNRLYAEFYQAYESIRYDEVPVFVTTDAVFHVYHLLFDKMLRDLEKQFFIPSLKELTTAMVDASMEQYTELKGSTMDQAALRNAAYFTVAAKLLGVSVNVPNDVNDLADKEVALIEGQGGMAASQIWESGNQAKDDVLLEDYSQYIPRGHYTRSEDLKTYFKAMMWFGRMTFRLKDPLETQRALLVVQAMRTAQPASGKTALELWQSVYDPTVFIVGKADDLSIYEYGKLSDEIFGATPDLTSFADEKLAGDFLEAAKTLPPPQVNSMWVYIWQDRDQATQGFRFMGQRFTLDAYIFGQMIFRKVGTIATPRDLPKSLDVLAAMGSDEAERLLKEMGESTFENFDTQLEKTKQEVAAFGLDSWTQNLYWSWLYSLQPIFQPKGEQFPPFMQTTAWLHKDMQTALSSWTELKHDTILYAKQVMAEMGGGGVEIPPKGYVEPNPEAYARLLALAEMTRDGLQNRGILDDVTKGNLDNLIDELEFLLDISQKELSGEPITEEEYWRIQYFGGWLEALTIAAADPAEDNMSRGYLEDQKSALIADVATGMGRVLEEGVGYATSIYVVTPIEPYTVAKGAVYSYYEFTVPLDKRMTDEDWRSMLESGQAPPAPEWTSSFIIP